MVVASGALVPGRFSRNGDLPPSDELEEVTEEIEAVWDHCDLG